jgi:hypothetical protein
MNKKVNEEMNPNIFKLGAGDQIERKLRMLWYFLKWHNRPLFEVYNNVVNEVAANFKPDEYGQIPQKDLKDLKESEIMLDKFYDYSVIDRKEVTTGFERRSHSSSFFMHELGRDDTLELKYEDGLESYATPGENTVTHNLRLKIGEEKIEALYDCKRPKKTKFQIGPAKIISFIKDYQEEAVRGQEVNNQQ